MIKQNFWRRSQAVLVAASLTIGIGVLGFAAAEHIGRVNVPVAVKLAPEEAPTHLGFAPVVKKVLPAVVNIASTKVSKVSAGEDNDSDDMLRQFFGGRMPRQSPGGEQREHGLGSGVIMSQDGYILTNNHVVDGATTVRVTLGDKREFKAKVIGADPNSDIAVLKIDATNLPTAVVADSSKVQVGDYALAIGDPFGVGQTVTMGIVSATGRSHLGIEDYEDFIQTDAPINPGNSGGALVNDRGQLIGINTAILSHSNGNQGIGFAIPVNMARNVMDQLVSTGKVTRAYLGIVPQDVTPAMARAFGVTETRGALVGDVSPNSPAQKGGLLKGDIILDVNGVPVTDSNSLRLAISMSKPDSNATLKVSRNGALRDVTVRLTELPTDRAAVSKGKEDKNSVLSGVSVETLDSDTAHELGLPNNAQGVVVTNVNPSSEAAEAGLRRGDVIQEVNRKAVKNSSEFESAVTNSKKEDTILLVNRKGNTMYVAV